MDIEKELKKKYPDFSDRQIKSMRIDAFNLVFNSQVNFFNWKYKKTTPHFNTLLKVCKELGLDIKNMDYE